MSDLREAIAEVLRDALAWSDYGPTIRAELEKVADRLLGSDVLAQIRAEAWDEGARSRQCHCYAFSDGECACGNYPGERNPYRTDESA